MFDFLNPKNRVVRKWADNDHWVFYAGNGQWTIAIDCAYKFTLKDAQTFMRSVIGARVSIEVFDN